MSEWVKYFIDPTFRGPFLGSLWMGFVCALVGVYASLRRRALIGEMLSHATYPGIVLGVFVVSQLSGFAEGVDWEEDSLATGLVIGFFALITALLGQYILHLMITHWKIYPDAALCFTLSTFFGLGMVGVSALQHTHQTWYYHVQEYLFGQAAMINDVDLVMLTTVSFVVLLIVVSLLREMQLIGFDPTLAHMKGLSHVDSLLSLLMVVAVLVGMRSAGIVLLSGLIVIPPLAAHQHVDRFVPMLGLASLIGVFSAGVGVVLSVELQAPLPTGPLIVLASAFIALMSLIFSPKKGILFRVLRILWFRYRCLQENCLKVMWKKKNNPLTYEKIKALYPHPLLRLVLWQLILGGWVRSQSHLPKGSQRCSQENPQENSQGAMQGWLGVSYFSLTEAGERRGLRIVRLHRLWEVYLVQSVGMESRYVHHTAEKMEHILSSHLEDQLTLILQDPAVDPHHQKIPKQQRLKGKEPQ